MCIFTRTRHFGRLYHDCLGMSFIEGRCRYIILVAVLNPTYFVETVKQGSFLVFKVKNID